VLTPALPLFALVAMIAAAAPGRDNVVGELASIAPAEKRIVVRQDKGGEVSVSWDEATTFLRARPGATSLEGATTLAPAELVAGDRLLCRGTLDASGARLGANRVVVMTRSDVETRRQREREDWQKRGLAGTVASVDATALEFGLRLTQAGTARTLVVEAAAPAVAFRRYAPGSVRFSDARAGAFADLAVGDQVRVLGNRSADGTRLVAEQVVSGAFRVVRGVVAEVDPAGRTLSVRDGSRGGGLVTVTVGPEALLRRLPPMMVMRLLRSSDPASAETGASAPGAPGGPASPGRAPDPDEALERLPAVTLAEVAKGEEVAVLGPREAPATGLPAIKLAVWTMPSWPAGGRGGRGRGEGATGTADPFSDLLGAGGDTPW